MANIDLTYKGLTGKRGTITIDNGQTVLQLLNAILADEDPTVGVLTGNDYDIVVERDTSITDGNNGSDTLLVAGVVDGDNIICIDEPTGTKEVRQNRKLRIASVKRLADSVANIGSGANDRYTLNTAQIPNPYEGNAYNADDDENTGSLVVGRPWT